MVSAAIMSEAPAMTTTTEPRNRVASRTGPRGVMRTRRTWRYAPSTGASGSGLGQRNPKMGLRGSFMRRSRWLGVPRP